MGIYIYIYIYLYIYYIYLYDTKAKTWLSHISELGEKVK